MVTLLSHDNSCDRAVAKQSVAPKPLESPVAMMRRGSKCEAFLAKQNKPNYIEFCCFHGAD